MLMAAENILKESLEKLHLFPIVTETEWIKLSPS
jgi:hypothetical protein